MLAAAKRYKQGLTTIAAPTVSSKGCSGLPRGDAAGRRADRAPPNAAKHLHVSRSTAPVAPLLSRRCKYNGAVFKPPHTSKRRYVFPVFIKELRLRRQAIWNDRLGVVPSSCASTRQGGRSRPDNTSIRYIYIEHRPFRHSLAERTHDGLGVTVDDGQQNAGGAIWNTAPLLPILHGTRVKTESVRELLATQLHALPYRKNMLCGGIVDNAARQIHFATHMGKNLAQGRLYLSAHLGSFLGHRIAPIY